MDKYERLRLLGKGSFGKVYLMRNRPENRLVCVKCINVKNVPKSERDACKLEVSLLRKLGEKRSSFCGHCVPE
jgi:serine/threonine protein kinase